MMLAVAGCATAPHSENAALDPVKSARYESRAVAVGSLEKWAFDGKLALSDENDGGSGKVQWRAEPGLSELDFRGAFGRGAWQLDIRPDLAILEFATGESWQAPDVSVLFRDYVGWDVPVGSLSWWVRGLVAPGSPALRTLDDDGRITMLRQQGWMVEYERYKEFSGVTMPTRFEARKGPQTVKLIMREWTFPVQSENDS